MKKVRQVIIYTILMGFSLACTSPKTDETQVAQHEPAGTDNQLTDAEKANGWVLLFDGTTLNGWQIFKNRKNNTWEIVDGTLHCKALNENVPGDGDERSDLRTTAEYENFDLAFDWKIAPEGNSGVMFRVTEEFDQPYYTGPEYQLVDDYGYPGTLTEMQKTGSNYDMHPAPATKILNPPGSWNSSRLVVTGSHVEHWLNGEKVVEYDLQSEDWMQKKNACKWKDAAGYGAPKKGYIDLQDHGSEIWFKNIKIKTL